MTQTRLLAIIPAILAFSFVGVLLPAENFRGETLSPLFITGPDEISIVLSAGQVLLVSLDPTYPFLHGLEFIADSTAGTFNGDFALSFFGSVDPPVSEGINNLAGADLADVVLSGAGRTTVTVPFADESDVSNAPGATITERANPTTGAIAVQLVPFMKGMSGEALTRTVTIRVRPLIRPVGAILILLAGEPEIIERAMETLELEIDGRTVAPGQPVELSPGIYRVRAFADGFLDYTGNIGIELGRTEELALTVEQLRARVNFNVPSIADVFWNGERVQGSSLSVSPGVHTVLIRLGDFSVSRQLELEDDGVYRIGLDLDILLNQD